MREENSWRHVLDDRTINKALQLVRPLLYSSIRPTGTCTDDGRNWTILLRQVFWKVSHCFQQDDDYGMKQWLLYEKGCILRSFTHIKIIKGRTSREWICEQGYTAPVGRLYAQGSGVRCCHLSWSRNRRGWGDRRDVLWFVRIRRSPALLPHLLRSSSQVERGVWRVCVPLCNSPKHLKGLLFKSPVDSLSYETFAYNVSPPWLGGRPFWPKHQLPHRGARSLFWNDLCQSHVHLSRPSHSSFEYAMFWNADITFTLYFVSW